MGKVLTSKLLDYIKKIKYLKNIENNSIEYSIVIVCFEILQKMLKELYIKKNNYLYSIYELISSDFDADRIDYTIRDNYASSLIKDGADIDRVLKTFCLNRRNTENFKDSYKFYPAIQALYDIDKIFLDRSQLYKAVINHHKVKRYDYLLQKAIEILLEEELKVYTINRNLQIESLVDLVYEILNLIINPNYTGNIDDYEGYLERLFFKISQITDYWLLSYIEKKLVLSLNQDNKRLYRILKDLFTGSKEFKSLWKRDYDAKGFYEKLKNKLKNIQITTSMEPPVIKLIQRHIESPFEFIYNLLKVKPDMLIYLEDRFKEDDYIILLSKTKLAKTPSEELELINIKNDDIFVYKEVSKKVKGLEQENQTFLPFYLFYHRDCKLDNVDIEDKLVNYILDYIGGN